MCDETQSMDLNMACSGCRQSALCTSPGIKKARRGPLIQMQATPPNANTGQTMPSPFAPMLPKDTTLANGYAVHKLLQSHAHP